MRNIEKPVGTHVGERRKGSKRRLSLSSSHRVRELPQDHSWMQTREHDTRRKHRPFAVRWTPHLCHTAPKPFFFVQCLSRLFFGGSSAAPSQREHAVCASRQRLHSTRKEREMDDEGGPDRAGESDFSLANASDEEVNFRD